MTWIFTYPSPIRMFKFDLGDQVKHSLTPFKGVIIARTQWLNGCCRYIVQASALKDGIPVQGENLDEGELELIKSKAKKFELKETGGPFPVAVKRSVDPRK